MLGLLTLLGIILIVLALVLLIKGLFIFAIGAIGLCILVNIVMAAVELFNRWD